MASAYKVLGQSAPSATTNTSLYTVPAATQAVVSTITVAKRATGAQTIRNAVRPGGAAIASEHWLAYDCALADGTSQTMTLGLSLATGDIITVWASDGNLSFSAFGVEIS